MFRFIAPLALASLFIAAGCATDRINDPADTLRTVGSIERLSAKLDALIPADAQLEVVAEGFNWSEGPAWVGGRDGYVVFSDVPENVIYKWAPGEGKSVYLRRSGWTADGPRPGAAGHDEPGSNGLGVDAQGRLVLCQHGLRQVAYMDAPLDRPTADYVTIADRYDGKRFNSPNDFAFGPGGALYFTDPPYGLPGKADSDAKELPFQGVYRIAPGGEVTLLTDELTRPNGIGFSPDFQTLYVAVSDPKAAQYMAYPMKHDGTVGAGRVLFDATPLVGKQRPGLPDGMTVDLHGNLFATGPGGVLVISPDGEHLGTIVTGVPTGNCTFAGDGSTLIITADSMLIRVKTTTRAARR